jgi:hypothetical protein
MKLDSVEHLTVNNWRLRAFENISLEYHVANIAPIAEQSPKTVICEWIGATNFSAFEYSLASHNPMPGEVFEEQLKAHKL